jgi:putative membrane protein
MRVVLYLLINSLAVGISAYVLPGVRVDSVLTAVAVSVVLGLVNLFLKPLFILLTLPITVLTLGLFLFVINGLLTLLVDALVPGFEVRHFGWALLYSLVLTVVSSFLNSLQRSAVTR